MAGCKKGCTEEFRCSNFGLTHPHPEYFVTSQWAGKCGGCMNVFYLLFRWAAAMGFLVMQILLILTFVEDPSCSWHRYLSNWSSLFLTLDVVIQFVLAAYGYSRYRKTGSWDKVFAYMPWYLKLQWLITNVATCAGFLVVTLFWTFLAPDSVSIYFLFFHGINAVYLFLNRFITAMPVRIYHVFYSWLYFSLYIGFDAIFQLVLDEPPAYRFLNWKSDITFMTILSVTVFPFLVPLVIWLTYYGNYRFRLMISGCCAKDEPEDNKPANIYTQERGRDNQGFQEPSNEFDGPPLSQTMFDHRSTTNDPFTRNQPLKINYGTKDGKFQTMANPDLADPDKMNPNNGITVNTDNAPQNTSPDYDPRPPMTYNNAYFSDKTQQDGMTAMGDNGFISTVYVE